MSPLLVAILKYGFLALLFLFVFWVARTITTGMAIPSRGQAGGAAAGVRGVGGDNAKGKRAKGSRAPAIVLVRTDEGKKVGAYKLLAPMQVGRAETCEICPPDDYLSQFHARLFPKDGAWFVEDFGSTNGTYLNEQKVTGPLEVRAGDRVRLGRTVLHLRR